MEQFIKNLARGAGAILKEGFRKEFEINQKTDHWDVVTQYDLASDKYIQDRIKKKFPGHSILSEETGRAGKSDNLWIIDPLDGTRNFSRGLPFFCVSISFVRKHRVVYGVIYDPIHDELFFAERGRGATLNGKPISVSQASTLDSAMACVLWHSNVVSVQLIKRLQKITLENKFWNTVLASAALSLAQVAAGRLDLFISKGAYPWDYSAAACIVKEAGAKISDLQGKPYKWSSNEVVAANPKLHKLLIKSLR